MSRFSELPARVKAIAALRIILDKAITNARKQYDQQSLNMRQAKIDHEIMARKIVDMALQQDELARLYERVNDYLTTEADIDSETFETMVEFL